MCVWGGGDLEGHTDRQGPLSKMEWDVSVFVCVCVFWGCMVPCVCSGGACCPFTAPPPPTHTHTHHHHHHMHAYSRQSSGSHALTHALSLSLSRTHTQATPLSLELSLSLSVHRGTTVRGVRWLGPTPRVVTFSTERVTKPAQNSVTSAAASLATALSGGVGGGGGGGTFRNVVAVTDVRSRKTVVIR